MKIFTIIIPAIFIMSLALTGFADQKLVDRKHPLSKTEQDLMKQAKIPIEEAKKIALKKEPGKIFDWELENENGRVIYSIQIQLPTDKKYSREVNVDSNTGKIVGIEKEDLRKELNGSDEENDNDKD